LGLPEQQAHVLGGQAELGDFFDRTLEHYPEARSVAGWVVKEVARLVKEGGVAALKFGPESLARLAKMTDGGSISSSAAKSVFETMAASGDSPESIIEQQGLSTLREEELQPIVDAVLAEFPDKVAAYRAGNPRLMALFIGQVMQRTRGRADPQQVSKLLGKQLGA
jgi:Asp-tRNA(Asn)/Glu-tRNA(Gln) amidotransferase B subunit